MLLFIFLLILLGTFSCGNSPLSFPKITIHKDPKIRLLCSDCGSLKVTVLPRTEISPIFNFALRRQRVQWHFLFPITILGFHRGKHSIQCNTTEASGGCCDVKYQVMFGCRHPDCRLGSGTRWMYGWKAKISTIASETGATFITALEYGRSGYMPQELAALATAHVKIAPGCSGCFETMSLWFWD